MRILGGLIERKQYLRAGGRKEGRMEVSCQGNKLMDHSHRAGD